jgi:hypothetical protein
MPLVWIPIEISSVFPGDYVRCQTYSQEREYDTFTEGRVTMITLNPISPEDIMIEHDSHYSSLGAPGTSGGWSIWLQAQSATEDTGP